MAAKCCWSNYSPAIPRATSSSARAPPRKTEYRTMNPAVPAVFKPELEVPLVREFFADTPRGFFVEVGANDPKKDSQSWHLEEAGWRGILVEPLPELASELRRLRKAKVFEVACSSPDRAGQTMQLH